MQLLNAHARGVALMSLHTTLHAGVSLNKSACASLVCLSCREVTHVGGGGMLCSASQPASPSGREKSSVT